MNVREILSAWDGEPQTVDERAYTRFAESGWHSFNAWAAELEFCELAAALAKMTGGPVIETGVGGGYTTRRLAAAIGPGLGADKELLCFESDGELRAGLRDLSFFRDGEGAILSLHPTPSKADMADAALTVLDSDVPYRMREIELWAEAARPGALVLVHDTGSNHPPGSIWMQLREAVQSLEIKGALLNNPRGSFLGVR